MKKYFIIFVSTFLLLNAYACICAPYEYIPADANIKLNSKTGITVLPEKFLREYDPVTIFFAVPKKNEAPCPEDNPAKYIETNINQAGEYRWIDSKTLQFRPASQWLPLKTYYLKIDGYELKLITLMEPPESMNPANNSSDNPEIKDIELTFKYEIGESDLKKMIRIETIELPGTETGNTIVIPENEYSIKRLQRPSKSESAKYIISLKNPVKSGLKTVLNFKLSSDDEKTLVKYQFSTKESFQIKFAGIQESNLLPVVKKGAVYSNEQAVSGTKQNIVFHFSAPLSALTLSDLKKLIRFSPTAEIINFEVQGNILNANCKFEKEKIYKIIISPANIKDIDNRILDLTGDVEFYFYIKRSEPFFNWKQSEGIVELFGPQEFPSTGRGEEKIDLRIYKIDPLNRAFWPFPEKPIVIDEKKEPPRPGQEPITNHPDAELIKILEQRREYYNEEGEQYYPEDNNDKIADYVTDAQISKHLKLLGSPLISKIIELPSADFNKTIEFGLPLKKYFEDISGTGKAGTYLVGIRRLNGETTRKYVRIQATDLCLSVIEEKRSIKFAVTSLKTGKPVKSAHIKIQGIYYNQNNNNWENLIEGISDENGVFNYVHKKAISANLKRIIVSKDDDMLVLNPSSPPPYFVNNHWHRTENSNWLSWLNNVPYSTENDINYLLHIFTERPIYKPDEEVFIKGYIRKKENGILEFPPDELKNRFVLEISAVGNKKWKSNISLNRFGSFDYVFKEKDLPTGNYTVCVFDLKEKIFLDVQTGFKKEAYKIPTFDIQIYASDSVPNDRPFPVKATAEYYAGGKITNRPVQWRIIQYPYAYFTETKDGFIYSSDNRFGNYQSFSDYGMKEDTGIIDYSGECNMAINPGAEIDGSARVYSIEATVTDIDMQTVTRTKEVISLPPFVIGLKNKKIFYKADLIKPEYKVLSFGGGFAENVNLNVKLLKREWHSYLREANFSQSKAEYVTESVDNLMFEKKILSSKKVETINIPELNSGVYILEIEGRDMLGRIQAVSSDFYVSNSDKPVSWEKAVDNVFKTVSDKDGYVPGETAKMVVKSPFSTGNILTVVEHPEKNIYKWNSVENGNAIIEIPIEKCFTPQLAVHFLLMRGRNGDSDNSTQNRRIDVNKPQTVCATNYIKVKPVENQIEMKLEHPKTVLPGSEVSIKIELKDNNSKPLSGELTLWLVDEAVLSLAPEKNIDPLKNMIKPVSSSIRITDYRNKIIGKVLLNEETGGDGKTHGDVKTKNTVRKNFKTVPYYNPSIIIGDSGVALVKFRISDDLTNFKIRAVVCGNSGERFGSAKSSISVRLPVIVQPALPRFVRIGDEFKAGGIGRIIEGASGDAKCSIETENALVSGTASKKFFLNSNKSEQIYFDMKVPVPELIKSGKTVQSEMKIKLSLTREYDNAGDAFEISIPIKDDRRKISYQYDTELISGLIYYLPEPKEKYRGNSLIKEFMATDKIAVLKTANALAFLARYPHGCLEQKISQSYSSIALRGILERFNMTELVKTIDEKINETFFYLEQCLGADGLYSYWPGSEGYVYLTAYIVEFLTEAKRAGYKFPDKLLARPITHLQKALRSDYENFIDGQSFLERVESLYALGRAGYFDASYARELSSKINYMNLFSKSRLMLALLENKGKSDKKNIEQLRKEIWENTIFTLRDGIEKYSGLQKFTGSPNDDLVLSSEKRTLANVIRSLWRTDSNNEKLNQMINELAIVGTGDGWGNTINNASALLALNDVISVPEKKYDETKFEVSTGKIYDDFKLTAKNPIYFYKTNSSEKTKIVMKESDKKVFGSFKMSYIPDLDGSFVKQENNGFVIENEFIKIDESNNIIKREKINKSGLSLKYSPGDIIEIHISVINPKKQNFVAITIPIAAGFEPMNPELSTSSHLAKPAGKITKTPSYSMYLDDEVKYYYNELPQGNYDFYFRVKAAIEGNFTNPAAFAELMYNDNIRGNSFGTKIKINN